MYNDDPVIKVLGFLILLGRDLLLLISQISSNF